jgi:hypothetical protein
MNCPCLGRIHCYKKSILIYWPLEVVYEEYFRSVVLIFVTMKPVAS